MGSKTLKTKLSLKATNIKDAETVKEDWNTTHTAVYVGTLEDKLSVKVSISSKDPELLKAVVGPSRKQKFNLVMSEITGEDLKLEQFQDEERKKKEKLAKETKEKKAKKKEGTEETLVKPEQTLSP
ncbi:MAG: hypothetical protein PHH85_02185 [Candidatus Methanoperedens sp.]|nr:hypothetical protein [Candidatus Methanoperedens sp.]